MSNNYQNKRARTSAELRVALPETVSVAMAEIAEDVSEGLLTLAVGRRASRIRTGPGMAPRRGR